MTDPNLSVCPTCGATVSNYSRHMQWHETNDIPVEE